MEISIFPILFLFIISNFISIEAHLTDCPMTQCSHVGPKIQFPFQIQGRRTPERSHSGFELSCEGNNTKIHFPSYGSLVVKSISYDEKTLNLVDPKSCVHEVFMNLNLSHTPFQYLYGVKDYLYLNCTGKIPSLSEVPCLRQPRSYVYVVKASLRAVPMFCRAVKTVAIPFEYSPYIGGDSFGLSLTWGFDSDQSKSGGFLKATKEHVLGISFLAAMVAILMMIMKIYNSKKQNYPKEEADQMVFGISQGTYEAIQHDSYH